MCCAIETCEGPVCVHEADDEGYAALLPAGVVDEGCEDKFGVLVRWCYRGHSDEDDREGDEGRPECCLCDEWECLAVTVEEEAEDVGHLVCHEYMPCFDHTATVLVFEWREL